MERLIPGKFFGHRHWIALGFLILFTAAVYLPHLSPGFVADDFIWLERSLQNGHVDLAKAFTHTSGFFRPAVTISFGLQYQLFKLNPPCFALFNLMLHMANILLVYALIFLWQKNRNLALSSALLFAMNAKANNMAVTWISGRTSLLFSFFMLLALCCLAKSNDSSEKKVRYAFTLAGMTCYMAALFSKETAVAAPLFVFFHAVITSGEAEKIFAVIRQGIKKTLVFVLPLGIYFLFRTGSDAFSPLNAPACYRYGLSLQLLIKNTFEYLSRSCAADFFVLLLLLAGALLLRKISEEWLRGLQKKAIFSGLAWFFCFILPVLLLPVRSDLYVYLPQVGLHVVFAGLINRIIVQQSMSEGSGTSRFSFKKTMMPLLLVSVFFWTVHLERKAGYSAERGRLSALFANETTRQARDIKSRSLLLVLDADAHRPVSISSAVSYGFNAMLRLYFPEKRWKGRIVAFHEGVSVDLRKWGDHEILIWQNGHLSDCSIPLSPFLPKRVPQKKRKDLNRKRSFAK